MAATVRASIGTGSGPTLATAETGIKYNRDDTVTGTTAPIPIPNATGTNFSAQKHLALEVTGTGTTNITNRNIYKAGAESQGLKLWFENEPTYHQSNVTIGSANGNIPSASGSNAGTPTTSDGAMTAMTTSAQLWDNTSVATSSAARNGNFVSTVLGVDTTALVSAGGPGPGTAITLPNILLQYDEA